MKNDGSVSSEPNFFQTDTKSSYHFSLKHTIGMVIGATLIHFLSSVFFPSLTPIVTLNDGQGQVQGKVAYSRGGQEYWQFLSIPYAQAPSLKFEPPIPAKPWNGVKIATNWPPFCLQFEAVVTQRVFGVEDCLFLNVFTLPFENNKIKRKLPVLVHIHGGGFLEGGSRLYRPDYFIDESFLIVTFNYRLGPFGFLNFEHDSKLDGVNLPRGNMGMKDQLLVLKWVRNNIARFGGDPNRVTILGDSAGAASVHLHVLSPKSKGLFHRAVSMSGSAFSSWGFTTQPRKVANNFAKQLRCSADNSSALLNCLQSYDPRKMVRFQVSCTDPTLLKDNLSPSVETVLREDTFLSVEPGQLMENGQFSQVPYLLGVNSADGALRTARFEALPHVIPIFRANWAKMLGNVLLLDRLPNTLADRIRNFYFGNYSTFSSLDTQDFLDKLTILFSDVYAFEPVQRAGVGHAKSGVSTYLYFYDYKPRFFPGAYSIYKGGFTPRDWLPPEVRVGLTVAIDWINEHVLGGKGAHQYGVVHGEEIFQLWNVEGVSKYFSLWEMDFSQSFVKMIADFVHGTNNLKFRGTVLPQINYTCTNCYQNQETNTNLFYMLLDNSKNGKVISEPFVNRINFWNSIGIQDFN